MTSLQLAIMMASYTGNSGFDIFDKSTNVYQTQRDFLHDEGMIVSQVISHPAQYPFKLTVKGRIWYDHILNVKFPIEKTIYVIE